MDEGADDAVEGGSFSDLLDGRGDASQRHHLLQERATRMNAAAARHPDPVPILDALDRIFTGEQLTLELWPRAERVLVLSYGWAAAELVTWIVQYDNTLDPRLEELVPLLDPTSETLLRAILARHAESLVWSYYIWNLQSADDWRTVDLDTFQTLGGGRSFIQVRLKKVNGESLYFTTRADEALTFVQVFHAILARIPRSSYRQPETVESFVDQARRLLDVLSPPAEAEEYSPGQLDGVSPEVSQEEPAQTAAVPSDLKPQPGVDRRLEVPGGEGSVGNDR